MRFEADPAPALPPGCRRCRDYEGCLPGQTAVCLTGQMPSCSNEPALPEKQESAGGAKAVKIRFVPGNGVLPCVFPKLVLLVYHFCIDVFWGWTTHSSPPFQGSQSWGRSGCRWLSHRWRNSPQTAIPNCGCTTWVVAMAQPPGDGAPPTMCGYPVECRTGSSCAWALPLGTPAATDHWGKPCRGVRSVEATAGFIET